MGETTTRGHPDVEGTAHEGAALEAAGHGNGLTPAAVGGLLGGANAREAASRAQEIARVLLDVIESQPTDQPLVLELRRSGKVSKHLHLPAWQFLADRVGVAIGSCHASPLENGWEAEATATRLVDGQVVGASDAQCLDSEDTWKDADDYARRSMAQCVPLGAEILTRAGFKRCTQVEEGEEVLAYDIAADQTRWTPLRAVNIFGPERLVRLRSRSFDFTCTPEHSWAIQVRNRRLVQTRELGRHSIVTAAACPEGDLDEQRAAAVIGWLITDGTVRFPRRTQTRAHIDQSKQPYVDELRELLTGLASESTTQQPPRTFPSGVTYAVRAVHRFALTTAALRWLAESVGFRSPADAPAIAARLSPAARRAMLRAMLHGDGSARPSQRGFEGKRWTFGQRKPEVMEAFQMLAALEGLGLGRMRGFTMATDAWMPVQTLRADRFVHAQHLTVEGAPAESVWCPTTDYGTWVMRLDGNVTITGNTRAQSRALRSVPAIGAIVVMANYIDPEARLSTTPAEEMKNSERSPTRRAQTKPKTTAQRRRKTEEPITDAQRGLLFKRLQAQRLTSGHKLTVRAEALLLWLTGESRPDRVPKRLLDDVLAALPDWRAHLDEAADIAAGKIEAASDDQFKRASDVAKRLEQGRKR